MEKKTEYNIWYWVVAFVAVIFIQDLIAGWRSVAPISYSQFEKYLDDGKISSVAVGSDTITGTFAEPVDGKKQFVTTVVNPAILERIDRSGIEITGVPQNTFLGTLISWVAPALVFFGIWMLLFRKFAERQGFGGFMQVGRSKAKVYMEKETGVSFADVAGVDEAKAELEEVVEFLRNPAEYGKLGARIPKGILLVGPPGTGKTLLAKAVAREANANFIAAKSSDLLSKWYGESEQQVARLFARARQVAPTVIFIDEIDSLAPVRGGGLAEPAVTERVVNTMLSELDGLEELEGVVVIGATNRPNLLDPALLRPGRFDELVYVPVPGTEGRLHILRIHTKDMPLAGDVDLHDIVSRTEGCSGADLEDVVRRAGLFALRESMEARQVTRAHFERALSETRPSVTREMEQEYERMLQSLKQEVPRRQPIGFQLPARA